MPLQIPNRMPGVTSERSATPRLTGIANKAFSPPGFIVDGAKSRDSGNSPVIELRAGLLMGKISASGKYAPTVLGVTTASYTSGGTVLNVSPSQAVEIARRVGSSGSGTLICVGPPTAGGTIAATAVTFSGVNTSTGDITVTSLGVNKVAGCLITTNDGSGTPIGIFMGNDGYPIRAVDEDGVDRDISIGRLLVGADYMDPTEILYWPADASLKAWVKAALRAVGLGYVFTDDF